MVKLDYTVLNAFTTSKTAGNAAAVIVLPPAEASRAIDPSDPFKAYPPTESLQKVATELNYPMTAFLLPTSSEAAKDGRYLLRWIDPGTEVMLCGHATIALSKHLFSLPDAPKRLELTTVKHGLVISELLSTSFDQGDKRPALDFPEILGFQAVKQGSNRWTEIASGLKHVAQGKELPIVAVEEQGHYIIVELEPGYDMSAKGLPLELEQLAHFEGMTVLLTQLAPTSSQGDGPHIHTRVLHGLAGKKVEDAATGSAHCALIPYYLTSGRHQASVPSEAIEHQSLSVVQQSAERGEMVVQWLKDRKKVRIFGNGVHIGGGQVDLEI